MQDSLWIPQKRERQRGFEKRFLKETEEMTFQGLMLREICCGLFIFNYLELELL